MKKKLNEYNATFCEYGDGRNGLIAASCHEEAALLFAVHCPSDIVNVRVGKMVDQECTEIRYFRVSREFDFARSTCYPHPSDLHLIIKQEEVGKDE